MTNPSLIKKNSSTSSAKNKKEKQEQLKPFIDAQTVLPEITLRGMLLGIFLAMFLGASNAYLGLKIGGTISGCIPAAVISMALLRYFKNSNILENNMVQTIASAGEVIAAGIIFTIPSLVMMGHWSHFNIFETTCIGIIGGVLGVLFSIPLRRTYILQSRLRYPEGVATAEVLKSGESGVSGASTLFTGALLSSIIAFFQTGLNIFAPTIHKWMTFSGGTTIGMGTGLSLAMMGSGYVMGYRSTVALLLGTSITWFIGVPLYSTLFGSPEGKIGYDAAYSIWATNMRFVGVGAFIVGGIWTMINIAKPIKDAILASLDAIRDQKTGEGKNSIRTEEDIPMNWVINSLLLLSVPIFALSWYILGTLNLNISEGLFWAVIIIATIFSLFVGFLSSCIAGYMTGIVGSSHSPLSGVTIMGVVLLTSVLYLILGSKIHFATEGVGVTSMIMMLAGITCCAAAVAGDNLQDLKTGHILGATPWKQQVMLIVGVIAGSVAIGPILQILYEGYGLVGSLPRPDMDPSKAMSAPKAALMSDIIQAVFSHTINWVVYGTGAAIAVVVIFIDNRLKAQESTFRLPVSAVALGMYLPFDVTTGILLGGLISFLSERKIENNPMREKCERTGLLYSAGLIAGESLIAVILAIPYAFYQNNDLFRISWIADNGALTMILGGSSILIVGYHFYNSIIKTK